MYDYCLAYSIYKLHMWVRIPLDCLPPNALVRRLDCSVADRPAASMCFLRSTIADWIPPEERRSFASDCWVNPILLSSPTAALVGAAMRRIADLIELAASTAGIPWSVIAASAASPDWIDTQKFFADDKTRVPIARVRSSIRMLPAPTIALRTPIA